MVRYYFSLALRGFRRTPWLGSLMVVTLAVGLAAGMTTTTLRYALGLDPIPRKSERLLNLQDPTAPYHSGGMFDYGRAKALSRLGGRYAEATVSGFGIITSVSIDGRRRSEERGLGIRYATAEFFRMFDVPLLRGRIWTAAEAADASPVVVLSEDAAGEFFPHGDAIGRQIRLDKTLYTVIGISGHWNPQPRYYNLGSPAGAFGGGAPSMFVPVTEIQYAPNKMMVQEACSRLGDTSLMPRPSTLLSPGCEWLNVWYLAHSTRDAKLLARSVKSQLPDLFSTRRARNLQLLNVRQILADSDIVPGPVRLYALLGTAFLALCIINAAGMQLSRVLHSTTQIGIRRALGASRADVMRQYVCDAFLVGSMGGLLGIGLTFAGLGVVRQLPDVGYAHMVHMDGTMFCLMILTVLVCSLLVGAVPAWIASHADPAQVIKAAR
jgi:putative ABC transport system permease protein